MSERDDIIMTALDWLEDRQYEHVEKLDGCFWAASKFGQSYKFRIRQVIVKKFGGKWSMRFRHENSDADHKVGVKTLWVYGTQVGWTRDFFDEGEVLNEHKRRMKQ